MTEIHFELLIGRRVMSANGRKAIGRIEEAIVESRDGEFVITEFRIGPEALLDRLGVRAVKVHLPWRRHGWRVRWNQIDISNQQRPRVTVPQGELQEWRNAV